MNLMNAGNIMKKNPTTKTTPMKISAKPPLIQQMPYQTRKKTKI